ncbi:hypothetical protein [Hymenobacter cellulosivorans]|uniref:DUF4231 domain-containing protein n=1 Tax=Hymenobacter cellulosivorans TaxID=2932249 RepID=A0ABY4FDK6_9BACT|nr:hypothetical protein [Hymenobacter cellulosivorans]UOQ54756.1 hypothetical protein MUN80_08350 [Hymenobacter cellulosivorans]
MPYRLLFLLSFLFVTGLAPQSGQAQSARKLAGPSAEPVLTRKDTAYAVHELFAQRRSGATTLTIFGVAMTTITTIGWIQTPPSSSGETLLATGVVGVVGILPAWLGIKKHRRYNLSREQVVLTDYAKTGALAPKYRRRLRGICRPVPGNCTWPEIVTDTLLAAGPLGGASSSAPILAADSTTRFRPSAAGYTMADSLDAVAGPAPGWPDSTPGHIARRPPHDGQQRQGLQHVYRPV